MKYIVFDEHTRILGAGNNPNTGDLAIAVAESPDTPGVVFVVSCWEPSDQELEQIIKNRKIYLAVMADPRAPTHAPVSIHGHNPFKDYGDQCFKVVPPVSIEQLIKEAIDRLELKDGDYVRGAWRSPETKQVFETEGVIKTYPAGLFVDSPGEKGSTPLKLFFRVDELRRADVDTPERKYDAIIAKREQILTNFAENKEASTASELLQLDEDLATWHAVAENFLKAHPEFKQRLEDYLKHE